jgi:hypothetical protein
MPETGIVAFDREKQDLLDLLALFVSRTPVPLKLHATFQTQYVCPICMNAITMSDLLEPSFAEIADALHEPDCKWYAALEAVSKVTTPR